MAKEPTAAEVVKATEEWLKRAPLNKQLKRDVGLYIKAWLAASGSWDARDAKATDWIMGDADNLTPEARQDLHAACVMTQEYLRIDIQKLKGS